MRASRSFFSTNFCVTLLRFFFSSLLFACIASALYLNLLIVPDGNVGLLKERTEGWSDTVLKPGYHWVWTAFVPLKWKLYLIHLTPPTLSVHFKTPLRYTEYLELSNIFRVQIDLKVQFNLNEANIHSLIQFLDENIDNLNQYVQEKVEIILKLKYFEFYKVDTDIRRLKTKITEYINSKNKINSFRSDWKKVFNIEGIQLSRLDLLKVYVPDYSLYRAQLQNLNQFLNARRQTILKNINTEAEAYAVKLRNQMELEKTKEVLKLLKKNPLILEYLKYQELNPKTNVIRIESEKKDIADFRFRATENYPKYDDGSNKTSSKEPSFSESSTIEEGVGQIPPIIR